jgi:hypothetical protein
MVLSIYPSHYLVQLAWAKQLVVDRLTFEPVTFGSQTISTSHVGNVISIGSASAFCTYPEPRGDELKTLLGISCGGVAFIVHLSDSRCCSVELDASNALLLHLPEASSNNVAD